MMRFRFGIETATSAKHYAGYGIHYPVRHGQVENWVNFHQMGDGNKCHG